MKLHEFYKKLESVNNFAELEKPIMLFKKFIRVDKFSKIETIKLSKIDLDGMNQLLRPVYLREELNRIISRWSEETLDNPPVETYKKIIFELNREESYFVDAISEFRLYLFYYES